MTLSIDKLERMQEMGLTLEQAIEIAKMWEEGAALPLPNANALRQRRYRQRNKGKGVTRNVTRDATDNVSDNAKDVSPRPPSENTPIPPLKGGTFPKTSEPAQPEKPKQKSLQDWASEIWDEAPLKARQRSGKQQAENALKAAMRQGADPAAVAGGLAAYFASADATKNHGEFVAGVHRAIQSGKWQTYAPEPETPIETEDPWPVRLLNFSRNGYWNTDWGPKPGKPGYLGPPQDLAA